MLLYNEEEWLDAEKTLELIRYQFPASKYADDAQFYLGEIDFRQGEFVLAAYNYNRVRTNYPGSEYARESLFKSALAYIELSPPFDRDQEYTKKAIEALNLYQRLYPNDNKYSEASDKITSLREKLAEREYFTATLYRKSDELRSTAIYYQSVIDDYPDTSFYEPACFGKIEVLMLMFKYDEALGLIDLYKRRFPQGKYLDQVVKLELSLKD
jgi:outer membrane protein assembly factor BamD